jgi:hypothetical protein
MHEQSTVFVTNNDQITETEDTTMVRVTKATPKVMRKLISQSNKGMNKVIPYVSSTFTLYLLHHEIPNQTDSLSSQLF